MLSDNQLRLICRITFLVTCFAPTLAIIYLTMHRPGKLDWAREIKAGLGVDVTIDSVETPVPNVAILRGLRFTDPELGKLLEATEVRIDFRRNEQLVTIDHNVYFTNKGLIALMQQINQHVIRRHEANRPWRIQFQGQATIWDVNHYTTVLAANTRNITLQNLQIELFSQVDGTDASLTFQLADEPQLAELLPTDHSRETVSAFIGRSRRDARGQSRQLIKLNTNLEQLPCWLLGDLAPEIESLLGRESRFSGQLAINPPLNRAETNTLRLNGQFTNVDGRAVFQRTLQTMGQNLEVRVDDCQIVNGEIAIWKAELRDGKYRFEIPPAARLSELSLRQAIIASLNGLEPEVESPYY
jgi:hypothetical protein